MARFSKGTRRIASFFVARPGTDAKPKLLGDMRVDLDTAKLALGLLTEGNCIRGDERNTGLHRDTICKLLVYFGKACRKFLDERMRGITLSLLQFDQQHTWVGKKQSRLPVDRRREIHDQGEVFIWT